MICAVRRLALIVNPVAGGGRPARALPQLPGGAQGGAVGLVLVLRGRDELHERRLHRGATPRA